MASYLLTGCAGFIGAATTQRLLGEGHRVVGIDNLNDYYDVSLKQHRLSGLEHPSFTFKRVDIEDTAAVATLFDQQRDGPFDAVLNLAARAGVHHSLVDPHVYLRTNAMGTLNLLEAMRHHGCPKMVLASTSSLYAGLPTPFDESLPVNTPISPYAASKKSAELIAHSYHHLYEIDVSVCRYFTVYGPAGRPDMSIMRFIQWIDRGHPIKVFGDGTQARDFTYIDDIVAGTIAATVPLGYQTFNLGGGGEPVPLHRVISILEDLLGKRAQVEHHPFHQADMRVTRANVRRAAEQLDWHPTVPIEEGLRRTVKWYRENLPWSSAIRLE